jgi:hypothetical protein
MNPDEVITVAPAIAKGVAGIIAAVPIADIVKRIIGPPADVIGEKLKRRLERCFEKAIPMIQEAGITPQAVPPKLLLPILEGASLEEDEDLHTMWAALLANAASPEHTERVRPGFIGTLRQMAPDEAALLKWISDRLNPTNRVQLPLEHLFADLGFESTPDGAEKQLRVCLGGLESAGLIDSPNFRDEPGHLFGFERQDGSPNFTTGLPLFLTPRGVEFVEACRPPKSKENG